MSDLRTQTIKAQIDFERRSKMITTVSMVTCIALFALMLLLWSGLSVTMGNPPGGEILRRGSVSISGCERSLLNWGAYNCRGTIVAWEPEERWVRGQLTFFTTRDVVVVSRTPLNGEVPVASYLVRQNGSGVGNNRENLGIESQTRPASTFTNLSIISACILIPLGIGLLLSWMGTRRAQHLYKRAVDKTPDESPGS